MLLFKHYTNIQHVTLSLFTSFHQVVTEHVLQESTAVPVTSEGGVQLVDNDAVYVAIDPNQPDVQQLLGQIQAITASQVQQGEGDEQRSVQ